MKLLIKNMVCPRCIIAVKEIFEAEGVTLKSISLDGERPKMSDCLSQRLNRDYSALSKLFSEVRGITIERFAIIHRIEYAKELLCYSQLSTSEVAYKLGYSSPAHLSSQFKQVTGMTPKEFRALGRHDRIPLDAL